MSEDRCADVSRIDDDITIQSVRALLGLAGVWVDYKRQTRDVPGLAVGIVTGPKLIWAKGFGVADLESRKPVTPDTMFRIASISKTIAATAVLKLRDEGRLHLDDPVQVYVPDFAPKGYDGDSHPVRISHLLTHTSGLPENSSLSNYTNWFHPAAEDALRALKDQPLLSEPGSTYRYSNFNFGILGLVVEAASGQSYTSYIENEIFRPLGMPKSVAHPTADMPNAAQGYHTAIWLDENGAVKDASEVRRIKAPFLTLNLMTPAGGAASSINEFSRYAAFQLGCLGETGAKVLAPGTIDEMQRIHFPVSATDGVGYAWAVSSKGDDLEVSHSGGLPSQTSFLLLKPRKSLAAIAFTNAEDASPQDFASKPLSLLIAALDGACGAPDLSAADLAKYTGRYRWAAEEPEIWFIPVKGRLAAIDPLIPDPLASLSCLSHEEGNVFSYGARGKSPLASETSEFVTDENGKAISVNYSFATLKRIGDLPLADLQ